MKDAVLLGFRRRMIPIPRFVWRRAVSQHAKKLRSELSFMSEEHHLVRNFAVRELPRIGQPLSAEDIAGRLNLSPERVSFILDDLERHMTFVCRHKHSAVDWAYPVTVEQTPHHITYGTGEEGYAA